MVPREELERWLNDFFNIHQISDYLPNGLQIEGREEVRRIVTGVSINYELIQKAASQKADAIIVHHGMFWKNENPVIRGYRKKRIKQLLECEINLFAYHLPLDEHPEISHNRLILEKLDVDSIEKVQTPPGKYATGLKGTFQMLVPFEKLVDRTNQGLNTRARYFQYGSSEIGSVFIISGGGKNELENAVELGVDAFLTGDAKESTQYIAMEEGINYIYAGHYNTEKPGMIELGKKLQQMFDVEVQFVEIPNPL